MSIYRITELANSREFSINSRDSEATFRYMVVVTPDDTNPENTVYVRLGTDDTLTTAITPAVWNGLLKMSPKATPLGGGFYSAELRYAIPAGVDAADPGATYGDGTPGNPPPAPPTPTPPTESSRLGANNLQVSFDISGEPIKIYQSRFTLSRTGLDDAAAPDFKGAINVGKEGTVEGVDIIVPKFEFSLTHRFPVMSWGYLKRLRDVVGHSNLEAWYTFDADELLFLGATGSTDQDGAVPTSFRFGAAKTEVNVPIRDGLEVPNKPGWYYLWLKYREEEDAGPPVTRTMRPFAAYVERVYPHTAFNVLGLG